MTDSDDLTKYSLDKSDAYNSFINSKYLSIKHAKYFHTYDEVFSSYRGKPITFVEIGVLHGGSLFMWREFFGPQARIIGVELNPEAGRWEADGFEIHIGDQSDEKFWDGFFDSVGNVDLILDDGGHTNEQQLVTVNSCKEHVNDGGKIVVEDVHTSYLSEFGNPSRYSLISWAKSLIDTLNSRFPGVRLSNLVTDHCIYSVSFYESFVIFSVDRTRCQVNKPISNNKQGHGAADFRHHGTSVRARLKMFFRVSKTLSLLKRIKIAYVVRDIGLKLWTRFLTRRNVKLAKRYFP